MLIKCRENFEVCNETNQRNMKFCSRLSFAMMWNFVTVVKTIQHPRRLERCNKDVSDGTIIFHHRDLLKVK